MPRRGVFWGLGNVACILSLFLFLLGAAPGTGGQIDFPKTIGKLTLQRVVTRQQAQNQLNSIHDEKIPVAGAAIGYYQGEGIPQVVAWWSRASNESEAGDQLDRMVAKIRRGGSFPYTDYQALERKGISVHSFLGRGLMHYTYRRGEYVYWIEAPADIIGGVFDEVMK
ncbi:MAG: hypothetical protein V2A77_11750 [Pseudomonadota bacterium]